ncbi:MAG: SDR family oxidoreductase [Candidatus Eremiobacteraeota bacterium]|nr:SDR family oxidoreductase [Candidatus Eremiobacteraeota bacterium]
MMRRALVTGAAGGLAAGVASVLARDGFDSVVITFRKTPPDATLAAIRSSGASAAAAYVDFDDGEREIAAALDAVAEEHGPFDTLVHAVGPIVVKRFARLGIDDYQKMFDGNVRSAVLASRALLPAMRAARFGRIVFFGSLGAAETRPYRGFSLYQAAKSALIAFARCLAIEEASNGVTVNVVVPGDIREKHVDRQTARARTAANPAGRAGSFEDVADAVRFFVAAERDFVTGAILEVTGGLTQADARNESPS